MTEITNPHDRFFKEVFSRPEVAEEFVVHFLPKDVTGILKAGSFRLDKDSFVDANLSEYFSDLLYKVDFRDGHGGFVYILFEHKSYPAADIAFQILRYMVRIWERTPRVQERSLPPVIPLVLYHGSARWRVPLSFSALYHGPESLRHGLWDFTYYLCDLSAYADDEIRVGAMLQVALLLMKHVHSDALPRRLKDLFGLMQAMAEQTALEFLETIFRYLGAATQEVTMADCREAVVAAFPETGETYMNRLIDEWITKGMERGIQQGMEQGMLMGRQGEAASMTIRLLTRKFGSLDDDTLERVRGLSLEQMEKLGEDLLGFADRSALTEWLDISGSN